MVLNKAFIIGIPRWTCSLWAEAGSVAPPRSARLMTNLGTRGSNEKNLNPSLWSGKYNIQVFTDHLFQARP
jgi:hypothetical protein